VAITPNGATAFKRRLLDARVGKCYGGIASVPYYEWGLLYDDRSKGRLLVEVLRRAGVTPEDYIGSTG